MQAPLPPDLTASLSASDAGCCCAPAAQPRPDAVAAVPAAARAAKRARGVPERIVRLPGGKSLVGTARPLLPIDGEGLVHEARVGGFGIDPHAVTNAWFGEFVRDTGYVSEAERFGWSFVFHLFVAEGTPVQQVAAAPWWRAVEGADWAHPEGPHSNVEGRETHPVVQVSLNDARAFAAWAGARLPTEAEWEHAARGGRGDVRYPWGEQAPDDTDFMPCNIWQGRFPERNTGADGWVSTCPVDAFAPNGYGLFNMCGNTWEWCDQPMRIRSNRRELRARDAQLVQGGMMLTKGGSYLCHASYCHRYRIAARSSSTADSATGHIGFRVVFDTDRLETPQQD